MAPDAVRLDCRPATILNDRIPELETALKLWERRPLALDRALKVQNDYNEASNRPFCPHRR